MVPMSARTAASVVVTAVIAVAVALDSVLIAMVQVALAGIGTEAVGRVREDRAVLARSVATTEDGAGVVVFAEPLSFRKVTSGTPWRCHSLPVR